MILSINYEEMQALKAGGANLLGREAGSPCAVLAPPEALARVEQLMERLVADISVGTLDELYATEQAVSAIVECLRVEMEAAVVATHPADETAVASYFDFAHALAVSRRLEGMAEEMRALIEVVTGEPVTAEAARGFQFPD